MKLRRVPEGLIAEHRSGNWVPLQAEGELSAERAGEMVAFLAGGDATRAAAEEQLAGIDDDRAESIAVDPGTAGLPFQPRSMRAFMLWEDHVIASSRMLVKRFFPPPVPKIEARASTLDVLSRVGKPEWVAVSRVHYTRHEKPGKPPSLRVEYWCGLSAHQEWICVEHAGYPRQKAATWWAARSPGTALPRSVDEALQQVPALRCPAQIAVRPSGRYTEVVAARF